jgi:hypothetical protein
MRKSIRLGWWLIALLILGAIVWLIFFPAIWIERDEVLGVKIGDNKQAAARLLAQHGVQEVLPSLTKEIVISKGNIDEVAQLQNAYCIRVSDYKTGNNVQITFGADGRTNQVVQKSVNGFTDLSEGMTRNDVIAKLRLLLMTGSGMEAFSCIPDREWIHISDANSGDKMNYLFSFDVWGIDIPNSYSGARLEFRDDKVSKIRFRWQLFETI